VPDFIKALRASDSGESVRLAFEFLVLTAARTNEVLGATWDEIDLERALWTIPANRMKGGREHRVPLTLRALEILVRAKELSGAGAYRRTLARSVRVIALRPRGSPANKLRRLLGPHYRAAAQGIDLPPE
jgi:integrase